VVGPWVKDGKAQVRLVAEGIDASGQLRAGLEIALDSGWHTYWRSPGDSGIAPAIDFSGSRNLGPVDVAFPVPERLDDGFSVTNVYRGSVILPLTAKLIDAAAGADLTLKLDIGVCAEVCMPDHFEATLTIALGDKDPEAGKVLAEAGKRLPGAPEPPAFAIAGAVRQGGTDKRRPSMLPRAVPDANGAEVFVEGPADWYPNVPKLSRPKPARALGASASTASPARWRYQGRSSASPSCLPAGPSSSGCHSTKTHSSIIPTNRISPRRLERQP